MPSNKDLIESINTEATTQGVDIPDTNDKTNVQLSEILKELKTPSPPTPVPVVDETSPGVDLAEEEEKPSYPYSIAEGKAITCKKGILSDGDEIKAEYVAGGNETLKRLVKEGYVIKS